jgi:lipopolysaccharide export system protein LptA
MSLSLNLCRICAAAGLLAALLPGASAEKADRTKPMMVEADKPGTIDLQNQVVVFNGNVVIAQGTLQIRAEKVEVRERADGTRGAAAIGVPGRQVTLRQKRDGVDEFLEGLADRIEYDSKGDTLKFIGNASVRRMRSGVLADEITGAQIVWDNTTEQFNVQGGAVSPSNPTGRVRAVFAPRVEPTTSPAPPAAAPLKPARSLGEGR